MDEELFELLQRDGRASYQELSEQIGVSRAAVTSRLNSLFDQGVLRVVAAVHPEYLGLKAIAHISIQTSGSAADAIRIMAERIEVVLVSITSGSHDIVLEVRSPDQQALYATIAHIRSLPSVLTVNTLIYVDVLLGSFMPRAPFDWSVKVDDDDVKIIRLLQEDGRRSFRSLAETINLSPSAIRNRVNALLAGNVIRIGASVDRRIGRSHVAAGFGLNVKDDGSAVVGALRTIRGVEFLARTVGRFDLVATVAAESTTGLRAVAERLRSMDLVVRVESWVHLETVKERYDWPLPHAGMTAPSAAVPRPVSQNVTANGRL